MIKLSRIRKPLGVTVIGSIALAIGVLSVQPSFAGSGHTCLVGNCPDGVARRMCNSALNAKGLKGAVRSAEFEKCKIDPLSYK
jgi:hypothetical protein